MVRQDTEASQLRRLHDGKVDAPEGYIPYDGQVIIRTRYSTVQRWKKAGWDFRRRSTTPYLLAEHHLENECSEEPMNPELEENQVSVKYVETGEKTVYEVES